MDSTGSKDLSYHLEQKLLITPLGTANDRARLHQFGRKPSKHLYGICAICGKQLEKKHTYSLQMHKIYKKIKLQNRRLYEANQCDISCRRERRRLIYFPMRKWNDKVGMIHF